MEKVAANHTKQQEYLHRLFDPSVQERESAFYQLCFFYRDHEVDATQAYLEDKSSLQSALWYVRYLISIETLYAFEKLVQITNHSKKSFREAAMEGFKKVMVSKRIDLLLELLESDYLEVRCFAIESLGATQSPRIFKSLMKHLPFVENNEETIAILKAFIDLEEPSCLPQIQEIIEKNSDKELREEALHALAHFSAGAKSKYIKACLSSSDEQTRLVTYLSLLRVNSTKWEKVIAEALLKEQSTEVVIDILTSLRAIGTHPLFKAVFEKFMDSNDAEVRMLAKTCFSRIRSERIMQWLIQEYKMRRTSQPEEVLRLLGNYAGKTAVYELLIQAYSYDKNPLERLVALEGISSVNKDKARRFLLEIILSDSQDAFLAAIVLTRGLGVYDWKWVEQAFQCSGSRAEDVFQVLLKWVSQVARRYEIPVGVREKIREFLKHENPMLRYLSILCLSYFPGDDRLEMIFVQLGMEKHRGVRRGCFQALQRVLRENPVKLALLPSLGFSIRGVYPLVTEVFRSVKVLETHHLKAIVFHLLELAVERRAMNRLKGALDVPRIMILIRNLLANALGQFPALIRDFPWTDEQKMILVRSFNAADLKDLPGLDVDFMAIDYSKVSKETKREYLRLFSKLAMVSQKVERVVLEAYRFETDVELNASLENVIQTWSGNILVQGGVHE